MKNIGTDPQTPAVTRDEFKAAVHILIEEVDDDTLFDAYLLGATEVVETATRRLLLPRPVEFNVACGDWLRWWLPIAPVGAIDAVSYHTGDAVWIEVDPAEYYLVSAHDEPQMVITSEARSTLANAAEIRVQVTAGYQAELTPQSLKQAIILIVKDWFDAGISVEQTEFMKVSFGCRALIKQNRYARPQEFAGA